VGRKNKKVFSSHQFYSKINLYMKKYYFKNRASEFWRRFFYFLGFRLRENLFEWILVPLNNKKY